MKIRVRFVSVSIAFLAASAAASRASADPVFYGPTPYVSSADSPFNAVTFSYFWLETFEDGFNAPGVSSSGGVTISNDQFVDSVDADDGVVDGLGGTSSHSFYSNWTLTSLMFSFDPLALGAWPTHAGIVWTDVGFNAPTHYYGPVTFEAFSASGVSLGSLGPFDLGDGHDTGQTGEDRFFGVFNPGGISAIRIGTNNGDWEVDHLQYGTEVSAVPEPSTLTLIGLGSLGLLRRRVRRPPTIEGSGRVWHCFRTSGE